MARAVDVFRESHDLNRPPIRPSSATDELSNAWRNFPRGVSWFGNHKVTRRLMMKTIAVLAALVMLFTGKLPVVEAKDEGDKEAIQGSWTVTSSEKAGLKAPTEGLKDVKMTFADGQFTWRTGEKETEGSFSLDATKKPKEISMSADDKKLVGIYQLDNDQLKICVGIGDDRPTDFTTKAGAKSLLLVLKREQP